MVASENYSIMDARINIGRHSRGFQGDKGGEKGPFAHLLHSFILLRAATLPAQTKYQNQTDVWLSNFVSPSQPIAYNIKSNPSDGHPRFGRTASLPG
jgi:hypothetical protein